MNKQTATALMSLGFLPLSATLTSAQTVVLTTAQSQFDIGVNNQGWWRELPSSNSDTNDNYLIGTTGTSITDGRGGHRAFFTFDTSFLTGPVVDATLRVQRGGSGNLNEPFETIVLYDVGTDAAVLNNNTGFDAAIYADLGGGVSYGEYNFPGTGSSSEIFSLSLNATAIQDINAGLGGYFSIGADMPTDDGLDGLFGGSGGQVVQLMVNLVPEPSTTMLLWVGLAVGYRPQRLASVGDHSSRTKRA